MALLRVVTRRFLFFPWYLRCRLLKMNMYCKRYVERTLLLVVVLFSLELLKFPSSIAIILYLVQSMVDPNEGKKNENTIGNVNTNIIEILILQLLLKMIHLFAIFIYHSKKHRLFYILFLVF